MDIADNSYFHVDIISFFYRHFEIFFLVVSVSERIYYNVDMKKITEYDIPLYQFEVFKKYQETTNLTSTRFGGFSENEFSELNIGLHVGDEEANVLKNRGMLATAIGIKIKDFTCGQQVHGINIKVVKECEKGKGATSWQDGFESTDGMITNVKNLPLMVVTADCAAVSFLDPINEVIGIAHAGKKGTQGGIVQKIIDTMKDEFGTDARDLVIGIGPCIHPCCYDFNLPGTILQQLIETGVEKENIENSKLCTSCKSDEFYSYNKNGGKAGRFANVLLLKL